jgi:hypothetical protein
MISSFSNIWRDYHQSFETNILLTCNVIDLFHLHVKRKNIWTDWWTKDDKLEELYIQYIHFNLFYNFTILHVPFA